MSPRHLAISTHSRRFVQKLAAYATASASLVAADASAGIIYVDLEGGRPLADFDLDFDSDGFEEFSFFGEDFSRSHNDSASWGYHFVVRGRSSRQQVLTDGTRKVASFDAGEMIEVGAPAARQGGLFGWSSSTTSNDYCQRHNCFESYDVFGTERGFLGFSFRLADNRRRAGWAEVDSQNIYSYGYQTNIHRSIAAGAVPEPPSLALLAAGAAGLAALRCRRRAALSSVR